MPQDPRYHSFIDQRMVIPGVPNTLNVLSNLPFVGAGVMGVVITRRRKEADEAMRMIVAADTARLTDQAIRSRREFVDRFSRFPYLAEYVGLVKQGLNLVNPTPAPETEAPAQP